MLPASGFVLGVVLEKLGAPLLLPAGPAVRVLGGVLLAFGVTGFAWMVITMKRARTPIHNAKTPTTLVERGPFRLTRNPMYLFGALGYAGAAVLFQHPWSLALLPFVQIAIHFGVVRREEDYLEGKFGDAYRRYKARVPRWI